MVKTLRLPIRARSVLSSPLSIQSCKRCLVTQPVSSSENPDKHSGYDPSLPFEQRGYRLQKTDFFLKKPLAHRVPPQYLEHSTSPILNSKEAAQRESHEGHAQIVGIVVSAGKMAKTVKVRIPGQRWEKRIKKHFASYTNHLVHDPNSSLVVGDVVSLHRLRVSTAVHHVVASIITPFGTPIEARPAIPTPDERLAAYKEKRFEKLKRRSLRRKTAGADTESGQSDIALPMSSSGEAGLVGDRTRPLSPINERARRHKNKAIELETKAEENLAEADVRAKELEKKGVGAD